WPSVISVFAYSHPCFSFLFTLVLPALPSFPTRRSSDLGQAHELGRVRHHQGSRVPWGSQGRNYPLHHWMRVCGGEVESSVLANPDRKSTRLNSSHVSTSYSVFRSQKKYQLRHLELPRSL